jgi:hypothetical protein
MPEGLNHERRSVGAIGQLVTTATAMRDFETSSPPKSLDDIAARVATGGRRDPHADAVSITVLSA